MEEWKAASGEHSRSARVWMDGVERVQGSGRKTRTKEGVSAEQGRECAEGEYICKEERRGEENACGNTEREKKKSAAKKDRVTDKRAVWRKVLMRGGEENGARVWEESKAWQDRRLGENCRTGIEWWVKSGGLKERKV